VRFHVNAETIAQDVQSAREALKREALAEERAAREAEQRRAELMLAREILKRGGCDERVVAAPRRSPWGVQNQGIGW
jgi:hypothetical protein